MKQNLWSTNTPQRFWRVVVDLPKEQWQLAVKTALPILQLSLEKFDIDGMLEAVLGETQFGPDHWQLSTPKKIYYYLKPFLPRSLTRLLRKLYVSPNQKLNWPIESRYVRFQWEVARHLLLLSGRKSLPFINFWPEGYRYTFVITHDVETAHGQANMLKVAELEENLGFRSSFNVIPERYSIDVPLLQELKERGFEIGIHGLKHDGKLYSSRARFENRAKRINYYLKKYDAQGFRSPLTHRQPYWMQALEIEYDSSFFDTDPYEPIPGGTMSIWPFELGKFMELPYTLVQDYTLVNVLGEKSAAVWLQKMDFLEKYHGMALVNVHPDYLLDKKNWDIYIEFLEVMKQRGRYWHALPGQVASWWRERMFTATVSFLARAVQREIHLEGENFSID